MNLGEFRQIFYFFQYQFYMRSERASKKDIHLIIPSSQIGRFLFNLFENPEVMHNRWDLIETRPKVVGRRQNSGALTLRDHNRINKQRANPPDHFPIRPGQGKAVIYRARKRSLRCRFMLFEFPEKYRKDQIASLYKSLVIYDLILLGNKPWAIAKAMVDRSLSELVNVRGRTFWEFLAGPLFEISPQFRSAINQSGCSSDEVSFEELFLSKKFTLVQDNSLLASKKDSGYDKHTQIKVIHGEVLRYLRAAETLTENIAKGQFHQYSSLI